MSYSLRSRLPVKTSVKTISNPIVKKEYRVLKVQTKNAKGSKAEDADTLPGKPVTSLCYGLRSRVQTKHANGSKAEDADTLPGKPVTSLCYGLRSRVRLESAANQLNNKPKDVAGNKQTLAHMKPVQRKQSVKERSDDAASEEDKENVGLTEVAIKVVITAILEMPQSQGDTQDEECVPQAASHALIDNIPDVDATDEGDANLCSEYVKDIYAHLRNLEVSMAVKPCYLEGREVTGQMRCILIDWLVQVQRDFKLVQETLLMTVGIIDRYLQDNLVARKSLQLVGVTAMLIAAKYEEIYPPVVEDFAYATDLTYSCAEIHCMERTILKALNYDLGRPPASHFLRRALKVAKLGSTEYGLAKYLMELTVLDYASVHHPPSLTAAAAAALSLRLLHDSPLSDWTPALQHYTGYTEDSLLTVMARIAKMLEGLRDGSFKQLAIKHKYESSSLRRVSCLPTSPRVNLCIQELSSHCS